MPPEKLLQTVDGIYEAALVPSKWSAVLHDLARSVDAEGTLLFCAHDGASRSIVSPDIAELVRSFNDEGWDQKNTRAIRLLDKDESGFVSDFDLFTESEMMEQPMYTHFLRPKGFGWGAATAIQTSNAGTLVFSIEKRLERGPVDKPAIHYLNQLRPHLARSAFLASRLEFERINAAIEAMQISGLASAALTENGHVTLCNRSFEDLAPQLTIGASNHLKFASRAANERLALTLASARRSAIGAAGGSFTLQQEGHLPAVVHLVPIRGDACDIFARNAFFMIVTPIDRRRVLSSQIIQELFDLTPAEARVAILLAEGQSVKSTATKLSLSTDTVRTHVKALLAKSGMSRQTDFVAAIASLRPMDS